MPGDGLSDYVRGTDEVSPLTGFMCFAFVLLLSEVGCVCAF